MQKNTFIACGTLIVGIVFYIALTSAPTSAPHITSSTTVTSSSSLPIVTKQTNILRTVTIASTPTSTTQAELPSEQKTVAPTNASLTVGTSTFPVFVTQGETVLAVMQTLASTTQRFSYTGKEQSGMGIFVDSINGVPNAHGSYWFLYINGHSASVGVSTQQVSPNDHIEWRYESGY